MSTVGIDIGGTGVRAALVDPAGGVGEVVRVSLTNREVPAVVDAVHEATGALDAERFGVGVPGFVAGDRVVASPNFPTWRDVPLAAMLSEALARPTVVANDANVAALGAWRQGGARGDWVVLTLGTGVGGGIVIDGGLWTGAGGTGAELGHIYVGGTQPCGCGGVGCLEQWIGGAALCRAAERSGHPVADAGAVVAAAREGAPWARDVLTEAGRRLGIGLTSLVNVLNPDVLAIAGGLTSARPWFDPAARAWLDAHAITPSRQQVTLRWLGRADALAIAGAAELARRNGT